MASSGGIGTYTISTALTSTGSNVKITVGGGIGTYIMSKTQSTTSNSQQISSTFTEVPSSSLYSLYEVAASPVDLTVVSTYTDPVTTECSGDGLYKGIVNQLSTFRICPRDRFGNLRDDDDQYFLEHELFSASATLVDRSVYDGSGSEVLTPVISYNHIEHCFLCSYTPKVAGEYTLSVNYRSSSRVDEDDLSVTGSWTSTIPSLLNVTTGGPLSIGQSLYGPGLDYGSVVAGVAFIGTGNYTINTNVLSVKTLSSGSVSLGQPVSSAGIPNGTTIVSQVLHGVGVYTLSGASCSSSTTITSASASATVTGGWSGKILTVESVTIGSLFAGVFFHMLFHM